MDKITGNLDLPKMDGKEVRPGVFLIGEPTPRPDLGPTSMVCLANVEGMLALVELRLRFKEKTNG